MPTSPARLASLARKLALLAAALMACGAARADDTAIRGSIELNGCEAQADEFRILARPTGAMVRELDGDDDIPIEATRATVMATGGEGRAFEFSIEGLEPQRPYLLEASFRGRDCPRVFWQGLDLDRVYPGAELEVRGYAARTTLEVWGVDAGRRTATWVGADHLDPADAAASVRKLRLATTLDQVHRVVLQAATDPFPVGGEQDLASCRDDEGVVRTLTLDLPLGSDWSELPDLDFNDWLWGSGARSVARGQRVAGPGLADTTRRELDAGAPLYLRAVAVTVDEHGQALRRCDTALDGVSGWVKLAKLPAAALRRPPPPPPSEPTMAVHSAKYVGPTLHPWPGPKHRYCVRAVQRHAIPNVPLMTLAVLDRPAYDFVTAKGSVWPPGGTIEVGQGLCFGQSSGGSGNMLSAIGGLVTGFVDTLGSLVNSASALWQAIKARVVSMAASVIESVGVPCDATCKGLLTTGLNIALATAGVPPDIPNLEQLKKQGIEYVAAQIADQSPVPGSGVLAEHALSYAVQALERYGRGGGGGLPAWLTMDVGVVPATLNVRLVRFKPGDPPGSTYHMLYPRSQLLLARTSVFDSAAVSVPRRFGAWGAFPVPGVADVLWLPVVLEPNLAQFWPPLVDPRWRNDYSDALHYKKKWGELLASNPCAGFNASWMKMVDAPPWFEFKWMAWLGAPVYSSADFNGPLPVPAFVNYCASGSRSPGRRR